MAKVSAVYQMLAMVRGTKNKAITEKFSGTINSTEEQKKLPCSHMQRRLSWNLS